jgi:hypothetical protein
MIGGDLLIIVPIIGLILFVAGKRINTKLHPTSTPTETIADSSDGNSNDLTVSTGTSIQASEVYPTPVQNLVRSSDPVSLASYETPSKKKPYTKIILIGLPIAAVVLLFSFAPLHRANTFRKLNNVELPLSNLGASTTTNGLTANSTAITFSVNKSYENSIQAKDDIVKKLDEAGISILKENANPESIMLGGLRGGTTFRDGNKSKISYNTIEMSFFNEYHTFIFVLKDTVICVQGSQSAFTRTEGYCEGLPRGDDLDDILAHNRPVTAVHVFATIYY